MKTTHMYLEMKGKSSDLSPAAVKTQGGSHEEEKNLLTDPTGFSMRWVISLGLFLYVSLSPAPRGQGQWHPPVRPRPGGVRKPVRGVRYWHGESTHVAT